MKKTVVVMMAAMTFASCQKFDLRNLFKKEPKEVVCPTVSADAVPAAVMSAFTEKYPNTTVDVWFNKDDSGFCASFTFNGNKTLAQFNNDGSFVKEEIAGKGDHSKKDDDTGCECEIGGKH